MCASLPALLPYSLCAAVPERKLRGHSLRSKKASHCFATFTVVCFQMSVSHVLQSIWPAAREHRLMVEIRIETSPCLAGCLSSCFSHVFFIFFCWCFFLIVNSLVPSDFSQSLPQPIIPLRFHFQLRGFIGFMF